MIGLRFRRNEIWLEGIDDAGERINCMIFDGDNDIIYATVRDQKSIHRDHNHHINTENFIKEDAINGSTNNVSDIVSSDSTHWWHGTRYSNDNMVSSIWQE